MKEKEVCNCTRNGGIDEDIRLIVDALNSAGIKTIASCCGHTFQPSSVTLEHNGVTKEMRLFTVEQSRRIDKFFPDVNGERAYKDNALIENDLVTCLIDKADRLYNALEALVFLHGCEQEGLESGMPTPEQWEQAVDAAHRALKNYQGDNNEGI